jgi:BTB/POZ domain
MQIALAAYSDYLVSQFTVFPTNEIVSIDLTRYPQEAVSSVVRFVYTGELELTRDTVGAVWQVAEGLGIGAIAGLCEDFLGQTTPENAIYHYAVAEKHQLQDLSRKIYAFIQER